MPLPHWRSPLPPLTSDHARQRRRAQDPARQQQRLVRFQRASVIAGSFRAMEALATAADYGQAVLGIPREDRLTEDKVELRLLECIVPTDEDLNRIMRYEAHLNRQLYQALHELEAVQLRRRGGSSPLARLDINTSPAAS